MRNRRRRFALTLVRTPVRTQTGDEEVRTKREVVDEAAAAIVACCAGCDRSGGIRHAHPLDETSRALWVPNACARVMGFGLTSDMQFANRLLGTYRGTHPQQGQRTACGRAYAYASRVRAPLMATVPRPHAKICRASALGAHMLGLRNALREAW